MSILDHNALSAIMTGATHVLDMGGKQAFLYYEDERRAHMLLPDGTRRHGEWRLTAEGYEVDWQGGPSAAWKLDRRAGGIDYLDTTGTARGRLARIEFGDSAGLAA
ncbi:MAG: hypothetical protein J0H53_00140 [Rhizobiales bacterium]|nr:hypothetical protein [Hyphomicrobiales bacterium]